LYEGIIIECPLATADLVLDITAADFNKIKWYCPNNCQTNAQWTINIDASEDTVVFSGDRIPAMNGFVTYNVFSSADATADIDTCTSNVEIRTDVNGNLLAPHSSVSQVGGVLRGKAIVCNYDASTDASQINRPCDNLTIALQTQVIEDGTSNSIKVVSVCNIIPGDTVQIQGQDIDITGTDGDTLNGQEHEKRSSKRFDAGSVVTGSYTGIRKDTKDWVTNSGKRDDTKDKNSDSSSSSLIVSFSLFLSLLFFLM